MSPLLLWVLRLVGFRTGGSGGVLVNCQPLELFSVRNMIFVLILTLGSIWGHFYVSAKTLLHLCSVYIGLLFHITHNLLHMVSFVYVRPYIFAISKTSSVQLQVCKHHVRVLNTILHRATASYCYLYKAVVLLYKLNAYMWNPSCYSDLFSSVDALSNGFTWVKILPE